LIERKKKEEIVGNCLAAVFAGIGLLAVILELKKT
jgi:hypothetical protein